MNFAHLTNYSLDKIKAERCRRSFFYFVQQFWSTIIAEEPVWNWHIPYLCEELEKVAGRVIRRETKDSDVVINIPPGTSKSTICTVMFPAWCWTIDPSLRILTASYAASLSTDHALKSRDIIKSDTYKRYFPQVEIKRDQDNKTHYKNTASGERYSAGTDGTITGFHAHIIIVDDPLNPKTAASEVERASANHFMDQTLSTRKVNKAVTTTVLIMQRLHEDDCTGHWLKKDGKKLYHICLPGEVSERVKPEALADRYTDGLLDAKRLSRPDLHELKVNLGSYGYAGQIMQAPAPAEGGILKPQWFKTIYHHEFQKAVPAASCVVNFFLDTSYTEQKKKNDPSAFMATCYYNHNLYILMSEARWLEFPELVKHTMAFVLQHGYDNRSRVMIEPKASGKSVVQSFKNSTFNVMELPPPLDDKVTRAINATPFLEAGRCFLVVGPWNEQFLLECKNFPVGTHDDQVDNLTAAITHYTTKPAVQPTHGSQRI